MRSMENLIVIQVISTTMYCICNNRGQLHMAIVSSGTVRSRGQAPEAVQFYPIYN